MSDIKSNLVVHSLIPFAPITKAHLLFLLWTEVTSDIYAPGSFTRGDHNGCSDSVEQAHCTLGAVKRYRALSEGGGLPNFWFQTQCLPLSIPNIAIILVSLKVWFKRRVKYSTLPIRLLQSFFNTHDFMSIVCHIPGRSRLPWSIRRAG